MPKRAKAKGRLAISPRDANHAFNQLQLERCRLLLHREIRWLRSQWRADELGEFQHLVISDRKAERLLAGPRVAARAAFFSHDRDCVLVAKQLEALAAESAALAERMAAANASPSLGRLATTFGLAPFERDSLLLAAAPALDETFGQLFAYAQDAVDRPFATPALAATLFAGTSQRRAAASDAFAETAPLRRYRLLSIDPVAPALTVLTAALRVDERIVDYIRGSNRVDSRVAMLMKPVAETATVEPYVTLGRQLARWTARRAGAGYWPLVNLTGAARGSAADIGRALCDGVGLRLTALDLADVAARPIGAREDALRLLQREAALMRLAYLIELPAAANAGVLEFAERLGALVVIASEDPVRTEREVLSVAAPRLNARQQRVCWADGIGKDHGRLAATIDLLVDQFDFGPREIRRTIELARSRVELDAPAASSEPTLTAEQVWRAARDEAGRTIDDLAQHIAPAHTFEDLVLPPLVMTQLEEIASQVKHRARVYETWGFGARLSRGRATSACFAGPTGCGKSAGAEALASRLGLPLYRVDLAGVVSKYIGETEKNLRRVFDAAEQSGSILFFDEADALFGRRTDVKDSHDRYANIEVNYLLQRLEDYRGLGILATNRKSAIDRAFLRRLRFLVDFPFPDIDSRRRMWRQVFPPQALVGSLDYERLAQMELAGGNIKNIAVNAAFLAAGDDGGNGRPISMRHVLRAAEREHAKIDKALVADGPVVRGVVA